MAFDEYNSSNHYNREMNKIKLQFDDVFGKSVGELEKQIGKTGRTSIIAAQFKDRLLPLGLVLIFIVMLVTIWSQKYEISSLRATVSQLNNDNALLKEQIDAQKKEGSQAAKNQSDKSTDGFIYHVVQAGDCFAAISEQYYQEDDYASELAKLNGLTYNATLHIGQIIRVPQNKADLKKEP